MTQPDDPVLSPLLNDTALHTLESLRDAGTSAASINLTSQVAGIPARLLAIQLDVYALLKRKLGPWLHPRLLLTREAAEQCSSWATAQWKARLFAGHGEHGKKAHIADMTYGSGVDTWALSQHCQNITGCELSPELCAVAQHNRRCNNLPALTHLHQGDCHEWLKQERQSFHGILIDPARRKDGKRRLKLEDCSPNINELIPLLAKRTNHIVSKLAPGLHFGETRKLAHFSRHSVISVAGENKEAVVECQLDETSSPKRQAIVLDHHGKVLYSIKAAIDDTPDPQSMHLADYIADPDPAIRTAELGPQTAREYAGHCWHQHDQLITTNQSHGYFPGRVYKVIAHGCNGWKECRRYLAEHNITSAHILRRGIPDKIDILYKKLHITKAHEPTIICCRDPQQQPLWIHGERVTQE